MTTSIFDPRTASDTEIRTERANRAVRAFKAMLPGLNGYARAITGDKKIIVEITEGGPRTDGKKIYFKPPIELGDLTPHVRGKCDLRDPTTGLQQCEACRIREQILISIYHEIAHIIYGTFAPVSDTSKSQLFARALQENGTKYAKALREQWDQIPDFKKNDYLNLSSLISPFLPVLINALEDARVDENMFKARRGTKAMFNAYMKSVFQEGIKQDDGTFDKWCDRPLNSQALVGVFAVAAEYDYKGWFHADVEKALDDKQLRELIAQTSTLRSAEGSFSLAFPILARLRELGFCKTDKDPEEEETPEDEEQEDDDDVSEQESDEQDEEDGDPESGEADSQGDGDSDESDDQGESSDAGESEASEGAGGESQSSDSDAEGGDDGASDGADGDSSDDAGGSGGPSPDGSEDEAGESEGGGQPSSGDGSGVPEGSDGGGPLDDSSDDGSSAGGPDDQGEPGEDAAPEGDDGGPDADPAGTGDDGDSGHPLEGGEELDDSPVDTGADDGSGGIEDKSRPDYGTPEQAIKDVQVFSQHEVAEVQETPQSIADDKAVTVAVMQGEYFEKPSTSILGVREHKWGQPIYEGSYNTSSGWAPDDDMDEYSRRLAKRAGIDIDSDIPESILGPALLEMRRVLSDNARAKQERHLRSGKINQRVLGKRAWAGDDRLFQKKRIPGKKSYAVLLGIDISGSTHGVNIALAKRAALAQAELCQRAGVDFAIYAHTANPDFKNGYGSYDRLLVDVYEVKAFDAPWNDTAKTALNKLAADSENLDGHTIEYYRKMIERHPATDKIILYYSDGKMPAANHDEELEILQREISYCKAHMITLLGVGIRTDSPRRHGLDTVQVEDDSDLSKVVRHLQSALLHNR